MSATFTPFELLRAPIFAEVIRPRSLALIIAGIGAAQVGCSWCIHFGMPCMFYQATGVPCPGCGLTRSVMALLQGRVHDSFEYHPFGALLLAGLLFSLLVGVMPDAARDRLLRIVERVETKTGMTALLMVAFMALWVLRITHVVPLAKL